MQSEAFIEALQLAPGVYVQAAANRFRLHRVAPWETPSLSETLLEQGEEQVTRQLMAGAFYAGFPSQTASNKRAQTAIEPSILRHIFSLASSYQTTHATPPTMRRVAERLAAAGQPAAAEHCARVAKEESGHDTLALMDLTALGLPAQAFVERLRPRTSLKLVDFFTRLADSDRPIATLGYAYALERMALFNTAESIAALEARIPAGIKATRCLRVHSAAGSDAGHVAESIRFIASLPPADRAVIVQATYATITLQNSSQQDLYPGDEAMGLLLDEFGWTMPECA